MQEKQNLIIQNVNIKDIIYAEYNPRRLTKEQAKNLKDSLTRFGIVDPVIINQHPDRKNIMIGGHQRCRVWQELGNETIPAVFLNLTLEQEKELNVRLNKNVGEFDYDALANFFDAADLQSWGFTEEELSLSTENEAEETQGDDDIPEEVETRTTLGDVYDIHTKKGSHRVVCGDSIKAEDLEKLMGDKKADMIFTDPPWNVNYGAVKKGNAQGYKPRTIKNDFMSGDDFLTFLRGISASLLLTAKQGAPAYIVMSAQEWGTMKLALDSGFHWSSTIIWAKDTLVLSRKDYHTQYEPIWYGWVDGSPRLQEVKDRKQSDLWQIARPKKSELHPTTKPVELVTRAILNSSKPQDAVLDLFGGSGTTLIAAIKSNRSGFLMELDPKYCDVIVTRAVKFLRENNREFSILKNGEDITKDL